ncbi:hypothetical protein P3T76_010029 [Phytophthora citrophthora]|uniref:Uncharacterized protein n=1 Tax=Phytophthora citrophthora TaxID=4793 RepID=A0AAD9LIH5_9STRA|nr:hypothetical protein P3T76_010029 [Phytophthora citrophthora]
MALLHKFDMSIAKQNIPTTKLSGGQRSIPGALYVDAPDSRTFSVPYLEKKLLRQPHYPHGWRIAQEFPMELDSITMSMELVGTVQGYTGDGGRYKWLVVFSNTEKKLFDCQELAQLIADSRKAGLDVTGSAVCTNGEEAGATAETSEEEDLQECVRPLS